LFNAVDHSRQANRLLDALPAETFARLRGDLDEVPLAQGTMLYDAGEPVDRVYFPHSGMVSLLVVTGNGGTVETSTIGREGAVGVHRGLGARRSFTRAVAQVPGRFSVISAQRFEQAVRDSPAMRDLIIRYTELLWAEAQQIAACNAVHSASARLCRWLLQTADRIDSEAVPLTQEFLAQMLGLRRTSVTLLMQALEQRGPIRHTRGQIAIVDRPSLEAYACECYQVIRRQKLQLRIGAAF
jgi:CRP-like cAMP-binding protein